jgi:iron complex outermembrane receptor protein
MHVRLVCASPTRTLLFGCTALVSLAGVPTGAIAQEATLQRTSTDQGDALTEIVVTAQKREQDLQDVPISLTAVTQQSLEANRITSVVDLSSVVPNLAARPSAGGSQLPAFTMRGITSYGVVPGSDKELSVYIDGVYIASTVGSMLDLPALDRIEVLRGPQGTLFGRNATVGAISVVTRNPTGQFGVDQEVSLGNYNEVRSQTRVDLPAVGPFSVSVSYVHDQRRGDIRNLGAGTVWTFPASAGIPTTEVSPQYLGSKNLNAWFVAAKFEPTDHFNVVNKFDWTGEDYTPVGAAAVGVYPAALGPTVGAYYSAVLGTQTTPPLFDTTGRRPTAVNNAWTTPAYAKNWGDSLTATYQPIDHLSLKNIVAYRESYVRANDQLDGLGGLTITRALAAFIPAFAPIVGSPFETLAIEQVTTSKQWSEELQAVYDSKYLTLTTGGLYFHLKTQSGGAPGLPNDITLSPVPFGDVGIGAVPSTAYNTATSIAGYVQAEAHITSQLDVVGGARVTNDKKSGTFVGGLGTTGFSYNSTQPSFSAGVNYKPIDDLLLYGKYSTAFVSGGAAGPITFKPEKAKSWEVGMKSDWLEKRLRANVALFDVLYTDLQSAQAGITLGHPELGLAIADQGDARAEGVEFESNAVPMKGVTLGAAVGYTDLYFISVNPILGQLGVPGTVANFRPTLQPTWTTDLSAEYDTLPLVDEARLTFRVDGSWRSRERTDSYTVTSALPQYASLTYSPATWIVNARIALERIKLPYGEGKVALWAKNLSDAKEITFPDILGAFVGGTEFQPARTFGVDLVYDY